MRLSYIAQKGCAAQKQTSGFAPLVGIPPVRQRHAACDLAGGIPYPQACAASRGSASLINSPLTRRGGLKRRARERAASVGDAAVPRR